MCVNEFMYDVDTELKFFTGCGYKCECQCVLMIMCRMWIQNYNFCRLWMWMCYFCRIQMCRQQDVETYDDLFFIFCLFKNFVTIYVFTIFDSNGIYRALILELSCWTVYGYLIIWCSLLYVFYGCLKISAASPHTSPIYHNYLLI